MAPAADKQADMQAAIDFLVGQGYLHIDLAGYSFGPWVVAQWASRLPKHGHRLFLVAPPVALMDFTGIGIITGLQQVIKGSLDDPASPGLVESMPEKWHAPSRQPIIQGADHSFWGFLPHLQHILADAVRGVGT